MASDEYRCKFCGAWIMSSPHCCEGKYESDMMEVKRWESEEEPIEVEFKPSMPSI